jgi:phage-related protein
MGGNSLATRKLSAAWNRSGKRPFVFLWNSTSTALGVFLVILMQIRTLYRVTCARLLLWKYQAKRKAPSKDGVIAITVSTNYHELLTHCIDANLEKVDHWIVVTRNDDRETISLLEKHGSVEVLFWNPTRQGRAFDKGGGLKLGQKFAHSRYPGRWYLILDSDICLPPEFHFAPGLLYELEIGTIYGASRRDFYTKKDFVERKNSHNYHELGNPGYGTGNAVGYFQLYALPVYYSHSRTAAYCDIKFRNKFLSSSLIPNLVVDHLGSPGNWSGKGNTAVGWEQ